jgi:acyl-CoA thioester hydrolase
MQHVTQLRVRYAEIDGMGTYYNARALEWFECGRSALCRAMGRPYTQWEAAGVALPIVTAHVEYQGRATFDDELRIKTTASMAGRARLRFEVEIRRAANDQPVCSGYTIHAITNLQGRPIRPPQWVCDLLTAQS